MRKMIFSAVALVAFSFAGMANEIEEKKVETTLGLTPCQIYAIVNVSIELCDSEMSQAEVSAAFQYYNELCDENGGPAGLGNVVIVKKR